MVVASEKVVHSQQKPLCLLINRAYIFRTDFWCKLYIQLRITKSAAGVLEICKMFTEIKLLYRK